MFRNLRLIPLLFAAVLSVTAASGQDRNNLPASDVKEIHDYTLNMDKLHKLGAATAALMDYGKRHPELNDVGSAKNLDQMVGNIQKYPEAVAIIRQNGMSPREYAICLMTVMQASLAVGFKKAGAYDKTPPEILQSVSQANLDFTEQHWSDIQNLMPKSSDDEQ